MKRIRGYFWVLAPGQWMHLARVPRANWNHPWRTITLERRIARKSVPGLGQPPIIALGLKTNYIRPRGWCMIVHILQHSQYGIMNSTRHPRYIYLYRPNKPLSILFLSTIYSSEDNSFTESKQSWFLPSPLLTYVRSSTMTNPLRERETNKKKMFRRLLDEG